MEAIAQHAISPKAAYNAAFGLFIAALGIGIEFHPVTAALFIWPGLAPNPNA
jgi:hypothetical protein